MNIKELRAYFAKTTLNDGVYLNDAEQITDVRKFVDSHLKFLESNSGNRTFLPYYNRLMKLATKMQKQKK